MTKITKKSPRRSWTNNQMGNPSLNEKNDSAAIVFVNCASEAKNVRLRFAKSTDTGRVFTPYVTSAEKNLSPGPKVFGTENFVIPARSIVTLVSEHGSNKIASQESAALNYDQIIKN